MKRYILDEVATREEATIDCEYVSGNYRYCVGIDGGISSHKSPTNGNRPWLKLTVLEGSPESIAEDMMVMAVGSNDPQLILEAMCDLSLKAAGPEIKEYLANGDPGGVQR